MVICLGGCGREVVPHWSWRSMTPAEREGKAKSHSTQMCRSCSTRPSKPAPPAVHGYKGRVVDAWEQLGRPKADTTAFVNLVERLGIRRSSVIRNLTRNGFDPS